MIPPPTLEWKLLTFQSPSFISFIFIFELPGVLGYLFAQGRLQFRVSLYLIKTKEVPTLKGGSRVAPSKSPNAFQLLGIDFNHDYVLNETRLFIAYALPGRTSNLQLSPD